MKACLRNQITGQSPDKLRHRVIALGGCNLPTAGRIIMLYGLNQPHRQQWHGIEGEALIVLLRVNLIAEEDHQATTAAYELPQSLAEVRVHVRDVYHHDHVVAAELFAVQTRSINMRYPDRGRGIGVFEPKRAYGEEGAARGITATIASVAVDAQHTHRRTDGDHGMSLIVCRKTIPG